MDYGHLAGGVRMGVYVARPAVSGPAGMAYAHALPRAPHALVGLLKLRNPPGGLQDLD